MSGAPRLQRDLFIETVFEAAKSNPDVYFVSADLGAMALDRWRAELPEQFIHAGISEQNMTDMAAGLSFAGKTVFTYAMACFATTRCYEQIKCALALHGLPATLVGVGVGLGYDDAGPTHYTTEDLAAMRCIAGLELWTPGDAESTACLARRCLTQAALRYVRLERPALPDLYHGRFEQVMDHGAASIRDGSGIALVSCGYMLHKSLDAADRLRAEGIEAGVIDLFRLKPLDAGRLISLLAPYHTVVTVEEHFLSGGFGSAVLEALSDAGVHKRVKRLGLPDKYFFENGTRANLHKLAGMDVPSLVAQVRALVVSTHGDFQRQA